jgi:hypothetical protein
VSDAEAVCRVLSLALQQSRPRRNEGRAAALRAVDDEVAILAAGADRGRARRPVDLWHMLVTQGAPAGLSRPGAWQDMAAGATGAIHGLGRTLDHRAFAMAAHGLTSGLARIRELDAACALTGEAGEALRRAGMAVISVSRALSEGTDVADRYAALTDDLAAIRDAAEALPAEFSAAILDAVAGHLAIGLGRRDRSGYTLPHGERIFLASEAAAAEAGACWFEQAAEGCNEEDAAYWMENAASARAARGAEAPARRF